MTREVMHGLGARILEGVLSVSEGESADPACSCGGRFVTSKRKSKQLRTVLGEVRLRRRIQRCSDCGAWRVPEDQALDVVKTGFSPGLRRMMAKTGAEVCFDKGRDFFIGCATYLVVRPRALTPSSPRRPRTQGNSARR